jgi:uncharacterized protein
MAATLSHAVRANELNERFGSVKPTTANKVKPSLTEWMTEFIQHSPFMVMATSGASGAVDASPKGGAPGFVMVLDRQTLLIPDFAGNNLFFGHRNILENPQVALIFLVPGEGWTVRVNGHAQIVDDAESLTELAESPNGEGPRLGIKIFIDECFSHCPKAFARSDIWNPENHIRLPKTA